MLLVRRTYAERTAVAGVSNVQRRTSAGAAENQKSNPLDESRVQARPSLSTLSPESNQPEEHYSLGVQSTLRQHDALAWKGNLKPVDLILILQSFVTPSVLSRKFNKNGQY